jgi:peptide-methionine (S)-S-oxide reductase
MPRGAGGHPELLPREGETLDMLSGELRVLQRKDGHRFSTDDLLCAWFACTRAAERGIDVRRALDLGTGIGSVAMMVAWRLPAARFVAIEAQTTSVELCSRSLRYNGLEDRVELRHGDIRDASSWNDADAEAFDLVTGSPPYFDEKEGVVSTRPQRGPCRFEQRGGVEAYAQAAAFAAATDAVVALVHLFTERERVVRAARDSSLAIITTLPVVLREGREPHLALYELGRAGEATNQGAVRDPLVVRTRDGKRSQAYSAARLAMAFRRERVGYIGGDVRSDQDSNDRARRCSPRPERADTWCPERSLREWSPHSAPLPRRTRDRSVRHGMLLGCGTKVLELPGVWSTAVGYAGGFTPNPTYKEVCSGRTGHTEVVLVAFDPKVVSYETLLKVFWESHDPTQGMRQGNDVGTQYRSAIYTTTDAQAASAAASREAYARALREAGHGDVTTEIAAAPPLYWAEDYHQQYLAKNPDGYCGLGGTGVSCPVGVGVGVGAGVRGTLGHQ